jgi:hypothetical protein
VLPHNDLPPFVPLTGETAYPTFGFHDGSWEAYRDWAETLARTAQFSVGFSTRSTTRTGARSSSVRDAARGVHGSR